MKFKYQNNETSKYLYSILYLPNLILSVTKLVFVLTCIPTLVNCSFSIGRNDATISFSDNIHNFGSLPFEKESDFSFKFSNPGETPLVIFDVKTSCGCTVADWTKKPVKPGESGKVTVTYDSAFPGVFRKEISVFYNGKNSPVKLEIRGQVEYPKETQSEER